MRTFILLATSLVAAEARSLRTSSKGCWVGPSCTSTAIGIDFSSNNAMNKNNCWNTKKKCQKKNQSSKQDFCFSNKGGICVALSRSPADYGDMDGMCYATKAQCEHSIPAPTPSPASKGCWVGPSCTSTAIGIDFSSNNAMNKNNCWNTKKKCQKKNQSSKQDFCFSNKGGMCVTLSRSPADYGDMDGMCYATKAQCEHSIPAPTPSPTPHPRANRQCQECLKKGNILVGSTWCWRTMSCYPTGSIFMPCSNSNCASHSSSSTCAVSNGGCVAPGGF